MFYSPEAFIKLQKLKTLPSRVFFPPGKAKDRRQVNPEGLDAAATLAQDAGQE